MGGILIISCAATAVGTETIRPDGGSTGFGKKSMSVTKGSETSSQEYGEDQRVNTVRGLKTVCGT